MRAAAPDTIRVTHMIYGRGTFHHLLAPKGHARATFDIDDGVPRRVLVRDLAPERVEDAERAS